MSLTQRREIATAFESVDAAIVTNPSIKLHTAEPVRPFQEHGWAAVCNSIPWSQTLERAERYAQSHDPISIVGELGTGKQFIAERIHEDLGYGDLTRIGCRTLATEAGRQHTYAQCQTWIAQAKQSPTKRWWLESLDELPVERQPILLELMSELRRACNGRLCIVSTSRRSLSELLEQGKLREDLYYALAVLELAVPPLRERPTDILALASYFSKTTNPAAPPIQFSRQAAEMLTSYDWPGNVTELRNLVARVRAHAERSVVDTEHLRSIWKVRPKAASDLSTLNLEQAETRLILKAVDRCGGNKTAAAKKLGITARTLHNKMQKYKSLGLLADASAIHGNASVARAQ